MIRLFGPHVRDNLQRAIPVAIKDAAVSLPINNSVLVVNAFLVDGLQVLFHEL
ncbi:hypothetical protein GGR27_000889 [Lewinella antarctica]|uniref:Uncharacterized protein n=1 Tax=Neolewinella antarctica TaxID=442734 RepID=A0ABX0X8U1_9BACT|nr:hypothetical protein [Neolewinella antarctica]